MTHLHDGYSKAHSSMDRLAPQSSVSDKERRELEQKVQVNPFHHYFVERERETERERS